MRRPFAINRLFIWVVILGILTLFVWLGAIGVAFEKLGVSGPMVSLLVFGSIVGSMINLPLFKIQIGGARNLPRQPNAMPDRLLPFSHFMVIGINVGGGVIPLLFSLYLIFHQELPLFQSLIAIGLVTSVSYLFSFSIPGIGIGMPILLAPLSAALIALLLNPQQVPALAYVAGTLGVLIGADLLRLKDVRRTMSPGKYAFIGGAGTFDGVFITGIIAVLLT